MTLEDLPPEMIAMIIDNVDPDDHYALRLASRHLRSIATNVNHIVRATPSEQWIAQSMDHLRTAMQGGYTPTTALLNIAAGKGDMEMLVECEKHCYADMSSLRVAAENGHLDVLKYFKDTSKLFDTQVIMLAAARGGHVHVLDWLTEVDEFALFHGAINERAARDAVERDHVNVLQWFHKNKVLTRAFNYYGQNVMYDNIPYRRISELGHLDILEFFYSLGYDIPFALVIEEAERRGHANIVEWARNIRGG